MNERKHPQHKRRQQVRKRKTNSPIVLLLTFSIIITFIVLFWGLPSQDTGEHVILTPADTQPGPTLDDEVPPEMEERDNPQSSTDDTEWNLTLVNKWNPIPENYEINLVKVPGGEKVDERIYEPLMEMLEAAREENWDQLPEIVAGYRTAKEQQQLYEDKIAQYRQEGYAKEEAVKEAEQWVAVPGYSEHQLGIAVDINGATYDLYLWLEQNSYKYGFIFRYPGAKTDLTGIAEEIWHYRYVGVEAATEIYQQGICLEEYLDKTET